MIAGDGVGNAAAGITADSIEASYDDKKNGCNMNGSGGEDSSQCKAESKLGSNSESNFTGFTCVPDQQDEGCDGESSDSDSQASSIAESESATRFAANSEDGVVNSSSHHMVAQPGSRVNVFGGRVVAVQGADIRAVQGAHVEFLPGSTGIVEAGTDVKLWPGACVKVVGKIDGYLHVS